MRIFLLLLSMFIVLQGAERGLQREYKAMQSEARHALVIGNADYKAQPLRNPVNDAAAVAEALEQHGFNVIHRDNVDRVTFARLIDIFIHRLNETGGIGLFYFAGHGVEVDGSNYLVPLDADIQSESDVKCLALDTEAAMQQMAQSRSRLNMMILDACRNNPYKGRKRGSGGGLAKMDAEGMFIAYAAAAGETAEDGYGRNGLFTKHLLKAMQQPEPLRDVFHSVRQGVYAESQGRQRPLVSNGIYSGEFYFTLPNTPPSRKTVTPPVQLMQQPVHTSAPVNELSDLKTSYIDPEMRSKMEAEMSPWMPRETYQKMYNGYYRQHHSYPIYIETNARGERRVLIVPSEGGWSTTSGREFATFKKKHIQKTMEGKKLLSLHINSVEGLKFYSAVWIREGQFEREAAKLRAAGIHPPAIASPSQSATPMYSATARRETSGIDPAKRSMFERHMSPWMPLQEYQSCFQDGGFVYKDQRTYPAYVEVNAKGERRFLLIPKPKKFYWATVTGRSLENFKQVAVKQRIKGKRLLSMHKYTIEGIDFYSGTWIEARVWQEEVERLHRYGIHPPEDTL